MLDKLDAEFLSDLIKISPRFFLKIFDLSRAPQGRNFRQDYPAYFNCLNPCRGSGCGIRCWHLLQSLFNKREGSHSFGFTKWNWQIVGGGCWKIDPNSSILAFRDVTCVIVMRGLEKSEGSIHPLIRGNTWPMDILLHSYSSYFTRTFRSSFWRMFFSARRYPLKLSLTFPSPVAPESLF